MGWNEGGLVMIEKRGCSASPFLEAGPQCQEIAAIWVLEIWYSRLFYQIMAWNGFSHSMACMKVSWDCKISLGKPRPNCDLDCTVKAINEVFYALSPTVRLPRWCTRHRSSAVCPSATVMFSGSRRSNRGGSSHSGTPFIPPPPPPLVRR